jgi:hypothetical protein
MDDFRVGSVPPSQPYGERHPYDAASRRRQRHPHDGHGEEQGEGTTDTYEAASSEESAPPESSDIEDYYRPSPRGEDE